MERVTNLQVALAGVAATAVGFAIACLHAVLRAPFLPEISAQFAVEYSPGSFTRFVIEHFGKEDKSVATAVAFVAYFVAGVLFALLFTAVRGRLPGNSAMAKGLAFTLTYNVCHGSICSGNLLVTAERLGRVFGLRIGLLACGVQCSIRGNTGSAR